MKHVNEFRNNASFWGLVDAIERITTTKHTIMEICGGQTHAIAKYQLEKLLPPTVELVHGPGCPVCVTPQSIIDISIELSQTSGFIIATFGDMVRVPGTLDDLQSARAKGADVRVVFSPLDAVLIAEQNPSKQVVFLGIGFETTAPANAAAILYAYRKGQKNFSLLTSMVTVPPAIEALMNDPDSRLNGILAAGHVCAVTGFSKYRILASKYQIPIVVTGFEPLDLLFGIYSCIRLLEIKRFKVENCYKRVVTANGNILAQQLVAEVFQEADQEWRGLGVIPLSGLVVKDKYREFDASARFVKTVRMESTRDFCLGGDIMRGKLKPFQCPEFGKRCTPEHPIGAQMVSAEGACSAYHKYHVTN